MIDKEAIKKAARESFARAYQLQEEAERRYRGLTGVLDQFKARPPMSWPDWCLMPMAAVASNMPPTFPPPPIAAVSTLYAWKYARSVYVIEPGLTSRLLKSVPDPISGPEDVALPEWCALIHMPNGTLWMHLEHDTNTGRPELRLLIDIGNGGLDSLLPIPVYLNRPTLTEGLADFYATTARTLATGGMGFDEHGGAVDAAVAALADNIDGYVSLALYLCRAEADIAELGRPGVRPRRYRSAPSKETVWLVGYADKL